MTEIDRLELLESIHLYVCYHNDTNDDNVVSGVDVTR